MKHKQGDKIKYTFEQEPTEGTPILAAFGSACYTSCPHGINGDIGRNIMVGSLSCDRCEHFGGKDQFAVATGGTNQYGGTSEHRNIYCKKEIKDRLEYLRGQIQAERISYSEIADLQSLAPHIDKDDVLLLEWAGIPE